MNDMEKKLEQILLDWTNNNTKRELLTKSVTMSTALPIRMLRFINKTDPFHTKPSSFLGSNTAEVIVNLDNKHKLYLKE